MKRHELIWEDYRLPRLTPPALASRFDTIPDPGGRFQIVACVGVVRSQAQGLGEMISGLEELSLTDQGRAGRGMVRVQIDSFF